MQVHKLGDGEPEYVVVGSVHGDEPCGKKAIERFLDSDYEVKKPVKFIIANEEALEDNVRFVDTDLNRSFPGDSGSENHEERLAAEIVKHIEGKRILDIHSTRSYPEPFVTTSVLNESTRQLISSTGAKNAVYFPEDNGTLHSRGTGIIVEAGHQGTEQTVENAYQVLVNFLAAEGVIEEMYETSNPDLFQYEEQVDGDWEFLAENFRKVEEGQIFAENGEEKLEAEESFYPVLMSTDGYEGMLGFKAKKIER